MGIWMSRMNTSTICMHTMPNNYVNIHPNTYNELLAQKSTSVLIRRIILYFKLYRLVWRCAIQARRQGRATPPSCRMAVTQ